MSMRPRLISQHNAVVAIVIVVLLVAGCAASDPTEEHTAAVNDYFVAWTDAWSSGDPYATIRFYDESVVAFEQSDDALRLPPGSTGAVAIGEGRSWLAAWIPTYAWHEREIAGVFLFRDGAAVVHTIGEESTSSLTLMAISGSKITLQSVLRWRSVQAPNSGGDPSLSWVDDIVSRHVSAWSSGDSDDIADLYTAGAVVDLHDHGDELTIEQVIASGLGGLPKATIESLSAGEREGNAVFVVPGPVSDYVIFVADSEADGCRGSSVVVLEMSEGLIKTEDRGPSLDRVRNCSPEFFETHRWWTELAVPPPVQDQVTREMTQTDGSVIDVVNGSEQLEQLVSWGVQRFSVAQLEAPLVASLTFAPVPACENRDGVVFDNGIGHPDLVICKSEADVCTPSPDNCAGFDSQGRLSVLHELAHVWLLANEDEPRQQTFVRRVDAASWDDRTSRWFERGVEQAAEVIAWGLMDEPAVLGRIGDPPCETLTDGFTILTGTAPLNTC